LEDVNEINIKLEKMFVSAPYLTNSLDSSPGDIILVFVLLTNTSPKAVSVLSLLSSPTPFFQAPQAAGASERLLK
jgi:hypothetical protein